MSPVHISIDAGLSIVATVPILYDTHLTTDLDISTETTVSYRAYSNGTRRPFKLSIVIVGHPYLVIERPA